MLKILIGKLCDGSYDFLKLHWLSLKIVIGKLCDGSYDFFRIINVTTDIFIFEYCFDFVVDFPTQEKVGFWFLEIPVA